MNKSSSGNPATVLDTLKPLKYPECVYLSDNFKCAVLTVEECRGEHCHFKKTHDQTNASNVFNGKRLNALTPKQQSEISKKYYGGRQPWREQQEKRD